jgi:hypothetical protein
MSGTHAILSPSKGAMILRCAAALAAGKGVKDTPSEYAAEGTAYHEIAAKVLQGLQDGTPGSTCENYVHAVVMADGFKFTIDEENAAHAQTYVDAIRRLPGTQYYEVRLDTSEVVGVPGQSGTGDAVTLDFDNDTIHVDDLKFGRGEVVFAEKNEQLIQYGAAALNRFALLHDWKKIRLGIHQPRLSHYSWAEYTVDEIRAWVEANKPKFQLAHALYTDPTKLELSHFVPGDKQCRWCPIRGNCGPRTDVFLQQFPITEPGDHPPSALQKAAASTLTDAELAAARDRVDAIEQWCSDIKAEAHTRGVLLGRTLPGWKVVNGRMGNRKFSDPELAEATMVVDIGEDAYKPKEIVTPTEAAKRYKKAKKDFAVLEGMISQAEGSKSLVRDDSPKQAVASNMTEFPVQAPI